jgi:YbbR domain-containing protein
VNLKPRYPMQFLVALIAAFLLWYALAAQRSENISVRGVQARLTLVNMKRDLVLMSSVPDTVSLQLRGPLTRALNSANPPEVLLDLSDARPGLNSYPINPSDIPLPAEVEVVSVDPPAITLELERQETRVVPVRPTVNGFPAPGFIVVEVRLQPTQFTIQGPESLLRALEYVETGPISIEDAAGPVEALVEPLLPDPLLRAIGIGPIQVLIEIAPESAPEEKEAESNEP